MLVAAALSVIPMLAACGPSVQEQCAQAKNPAECAQVASAGGDVSDYLVYGMAGYMLSSAINGAGQRQPVIVADPGYHGPRRSIASYQASPSRVRRSTTVTTTTRRGPFGTKTTTRTTSWSSRPAYRPASYRSTSYSSSYRGSRR
jgi:hypothetical protein